MSRPPVTVLSVDENRTLEVVLWQRRGAESSPITYKTKKLFTKSSGSPELGWNSQGQFFHREICNPLSPRLAEPKELCLVCHDGFLVIVLVLNCKYI